MLEHSKLFKASECAPNQRVTRVVGEVTLASIACYELANLGSRALPFTDSDYWHMNEDDRAKLII
jgi:hypothetical protein